MSDSTFYSDFTYAEMFGVDSIIATFNRTFNECKENYENLTALVSTLYHKIWEDGEQSDSISILYDDLWDKAYTYACDNLKGEELNYFYRETHKK